MWKVVRFLLKPSVACQALAVALLVCAGCGRIGYDALAQSGGGSTGTGLGGASVAGSGGSAGAGGSAAGAGGSALGTGGGTGGALGTGGVTGTGGASSGGDAAPNTTCSQAGTATQFWSFDTDAQGWELSGPGSMVWTGAVGDPVVGALQVDWGGGSSTHPRLVQALGDLRGRIITAEVWVDAGTNVTAKLFVQTGTKQVWADGGVVTPTPGQWTCLALDVDNPAFSHQQYDPTSVAIVGLELDGTGATRIYFDTFAY
ncbi:MAG TPA: hypothetical protein VKQ32_20470 [Polyangia bacterium]|nr:hypothetical protein [Polyangia bacterium]